MVEMASDWECVPRCYEATKNHLQSRRTYEHPLKLSTVTVVDSKAARAASLGSNTSSRSSSVSLLAEALPPSFEGTDPLSQFARQEEELMDPLSQMASEYETFKISRTKRDKDTCADEILSWSSRRLGILNRFTTSEKLSITTSFLSKGSSGADAIKAQTVVADKVRFRLEQLDNFEDDSVRHMMDLTQQEYIQRIEQLNQELVQSWHNDQRVKALKIAIQCAKMLADTSVLSFYPSQFVLITDILDMFGKLVYERLKQKSSNDDGIRSSRRTNAESARDTCQNWFFKIASIRELLPRIYVEMAILRCYEFLAESSYEENLRRLTRMIRGIADPLVAMYTRCYLVRLGLTVTQSKHYILANFEDFLNIHHMIFSGAIRSELMRQRIDMSTYLSLYGPALDFVLQALVHKSNLFAEKVLQETQKIRNNGSLLMAILHAVQPEFIAAHALEFVQTLTQSTTDGVSKSQLFRALGASMSSCAPLHEERSTFLRAAFATINSFTNPAEYVNCVESWAPFIAENFPVNEVNCFLGELNMRLGSSKIYEKYYTQLQNILEKTLQHFKPIELLLVQEQFLPFLDLFQKESVRLEICKSILSTYKRNGQEYTSDTVLTNALMHIGKTLNDSVTALTVADERRHIAQLVSSFVRKVNFGRDFERQLSFFVEARGTFANLDAVYVTLVHAVNKLAVETRRLIAGKHTRKTAAFVRACVAFCFITIPSIVSVQQQMDLYLLSGQVALLNECLGQADSCFEAGLHLVAELPGSIEIEGKVRSLETYLVSYLCNMLATLVVVPDSPERGVLYLLRLLLEMVKKFPFGQHSSGPGTVYLHALDMLYVQSLEEFPYHIAHVVSNDELYGHDRKFLAEINNLCVDVIEQILVELKSLGAGQQLRTQATLSLELLLRIVRYADLSKEHTFQLSVNLWMLAKKLERNLDPKLMTQSIRSIQETYTLVRESNTPHAQSLGQLLDRIRHK